MFAVENKRLYTDFSFLFFSLKDTQRCKFLLSITVHPLTSVLLLMKPSNNQTDQANKKTYRPSSICCTICYPFTIVTVQTTVHKWGLRLAEDGVRKNVISFSNQKYCLCHQTQENEMCLVVILSVFKLHINIKTKISNTLSNQQDILIGFKIKNLI